MVSRKPTEPPSDSDPSWDSIFGGSGDVERDTPARQASQPEPTKAEKPAKPPKAEKPVEQATPPPASVSILGPPPDDAMAGAKWAYQMHLRLAEVAFNDPKLSQEAREKRVMKLLSGAARHMTDAMRYDVAQTIEEERRQLEAKKRGRAAAVAEKAPRPPITAKVIPLRRDGKG